MSEVKNPVPSTAPEEAVKLLPDGVTKEKVNELARKHGMLYPVRVKKNGQTYVGLFKKPTLAIMGAAASSGDDPIQQGRVLYTNCKVVTDAVMDSDEEVFFGATTGVNKLFKVLAAEVGEPFVAE